MSKIKKLLAIVLSLAMIMGMSLTTFAADNIVGNSDDVGTITVNGITPEDGIAVTAYQIVEAQYDQTTDAFTGYNALYDSIDDSGDIVAPDDIDQDTLNSILADIRGNNPTVDPARSYTMTSTNGTSYSAEVPVGTYLVVIENAETKVYNPVVVSVSYVNAEGGNDLSEGIVGISDNNNAWVKVSDVPNVDKSVSDADDEKDQNGNSVNVGDTVTYKVTINPIPNYGGDHPVLNVVDTLSAGLTYQGNVKVEIQTAAGVSVDELDEDTHFTLTPGRTAEGLDTITVDFVVGGEYTLNSFTGNNYKVVITYDAIVNNNAVVNAGGNNNDVILNYTTDSKTTGHNDTDEDKTYTYTFDIDGSTTGTKEIITKVGEGEDKEALSGALFGLYTDRSCDEDDLYTNNVFTGTVTSDKEGQLYISGLAAGTYYLKEISAPDGYSINTHVFEIVISASYNPDGTLASWKVTIDGTEEASFTVDHTSGIPVTTPDIDGVDIKNTHLSSLPSTGGMGTTIFTIGGCVIMIAAAGLYFTSRRRQENK